MPVGAPNFSMKAAIVSSLFLASAASAQFVQTPTNFTNATGYAGVGVRYKEVPTGICELDPDVKSYSGYADVEENQHIFWWFFESRNIDPTQAPLTIWINGGPGSSSMIGLFQELGPCGIDINGDVYSNPYSWSNVSNMIFIDQPTTTGFSYSIPVPGYTESNYILPNTNDIIILPNNTCPDYAQSASCGTYSTPNMTLTANSTVNAAPNFWKTLQGFVGVFPQYAQNGIFFTTESYGGHYGPVFSQYILQQNNHSSVQNSTHLDLRGTLVGNGWFDPILQYEAYYQFTYESTYTYPELPYNASFDNQVNNALYGPGNCIDRLRDCNRYNYTSGLYGNEVCTAADNFCLSNLEEPYDVVTNRDEYDSRELMPDPFPYDFYVDYLNTPDVQAAIGAFVNFSESSDTTGNAFGSTGDDAREMGVKAAIEYILGQGLPFVMYFG